MDLGSLIEVKTASLLHDPPCKAYSIKGAVHSRAQDYGGGHKGDAKAIASDLGLLEILEKHWSTVKAIDATASSFDRMLLPYKDRLDKPSRVILINIFDPSICLGDEMTCTDLGTMRKYVAKALPEYISGLKEIFDSVNDPILRYHLLWTLLEPLWFKYCDRIECISPADTRVPTHTVFDHIYATAMTANIYDGKGFQGYAVIIDFASIQGYISESRKLRDLWASSWIGSLLGWITIEPFVAILGPDIVVTPSLRGNWFYLAWLNTKVANNIVDKIKKVLISPYKYPGWPLLPIMPTRLVLFIPRITSVPNTLFTKKYSDVARALVKGSIEDIRKFIQGYTKKKWKDIVEFLEPFIRILVEATCKVYGISEKDIDSVVRKARDLASSIPLPIRIVIVDLEKEYKGYLEWLKSRDLIIRDNKIYTIDSSGEEVEVCEKNTLFYHYIVAERLPLLESVYKLSRVEPGVGKNWKLPDQIVHKLGFCSVCGKRLAITGALRTDYEKFYNEAMKIAKELLEEYKGTDYEEYIDRFRRIRTVILGEGERLCPICLVKRLISFFYMIVLRKLGLEYNPSDKREFWIPSVSDIANIEVIKETIKYLKELHEKHSDLLRRHPLVFGGRRIDSSGLPRRLHSDVDIENVLKLYREIYEPLFGELSDTIFREHLGTIVEAIIDRETYRRISSQVDKVPSEIKDVSREFREIIDRLRGMRRTRFAIIRGDGDRVGSGLLQGILGFNGEEYIRRIISHLPDYWRRYRSIVDKWIGRIRLITSKLSVDKEKTITIPITPAYHYSLSRALSLIAIRDALITEEYYGVTVYAGGDDILVISPAYAGIGNKAMVFVPLEIVKRTRRNYWGEENIHRNRSLYRGFIISLDHELRDPNRIDIIAPSIRIYGRTYSIVVSHHRDPLHISMKYSAHLEEYVKEHTVFINLGGFASSGKDIIGALAKHIGKSIEELSSIVGVYGIQDLLCGCDLECLCRDHLAILETHSGEVAILPLGPLGVLSICQSIDLANTIISELGLVSSRSSLSISVLYDVYRFYRDIDKISRDLRFNELDKIFNHIVERNMQGSREEEPLKELFKHLISDVGILTRFYELVDRPSGILSEVLIGGVEYGGGLFKHYPFLLQLLSTARIAKKSMR